MLWGVREAELRQRAHVLAPVAVVAAGLLTLAASSCGGSSGSERFERSLQGRYDLSRAQSACIARYVDRDLPDAVQGQLERAGISGVPGADRQRLAEIFVACTGPVAPKP